MINRRLLARYGTLTGSTAFGVAGRDADEDWLLFAGDAGQCGVRIELATHTYGTVADDFCVYREGSINVILWFTLEFRDQWIKAHRHCLIERPPSKARRKAIFRHYMEGPKLP